MALAFRAKAGSSGYYQSSSFSWTSLTKSETVAHCAKSVGGTEWPNFPSTIDIKLIKLIESHPKSSNNSLPSNVSRSSSRISSTKLRNSDFFIVQGSIYRGERGFAGVPNATVSSDKSLRTVAPAPTIHRVPIEMH